MYDVLRILNMTFMPGGLPDPSMLIIWKMYNIFDIEEKAPPSWESQSD